MVSLIVRLYHSKVQVVSQGSPFTMVNAEKQGSVGTGFPANREPSTASMTASDELPADESTSADSAEDEEATAAGSAKPRRWLGLCPKNSIHSVEDFRRTVQNDPVLARHFASFNWETAQLGHQENELSVYVSYRLGDEIRRTSKPIKLPKGDGYITDGLHIVRTYCCNDYAIPPPGSPSAGGDMVEENSLPPMNPVALIEGPPAQPYNAPPPVIASIGKPNQPAEPGVPVQPHEEPHADVPTLYTPTQPPSYPKSPTPTGTPEEEPYTPNNPPEEPNNPPAAPVPEPTTILLFASGMLGMAAARRKKKA